MRCCARRRLVMPLRFGDDSFLPHLAAARALGIEPTIVKLPGIGLDIDQPADLEALRRATPHMTTRAIRLLEDCHHRAFLTELGADRDQSAGVVSGGTSSDTLAMRVARVSWPGVSWPPTAFCARAGAPVLCTRHLVQVTQAMTPEPGQVSRSRHGITQAKRVPTGPEAPALGRIAGRPVDACRIRLGSCQHRRNRHAKHRLLLTGQEDRVGDVHAVSLAAQPGRDQHLAAVSRR